MSSKLCEHPQQRHGMTVCCSCLRPIPTPTNTVRNMVHPTPKARTFTARVWQVCRWCGSQGGSKRAQNEGMAWMGCGCWLRPTRACPSAGKANCTAPPWITCLAKQVALGCLRCGVLKVDDPSSQSNGDCQRNCQYVQEKHMCAMALPTVSCNS